MASFGCWHPQGARHAPVVLSQKVPGTCSLKVFSAKTFTSLAQLEAGRPVAQGHAGEARWLPAPLASSLDRGAAAHAGTCSAAAAGENDGGNAGG